ncbi:MAG: DUF6677 family protein [Planctomycetota bacterium]
MPTKSAKPKAVAGDVVMADGEELNLRNRNLAAFLAWVIPGAGHFYQQRYLKSAIFSASVFTTFLIGMMVSGGKCVYASWNQTEKRWQYVLQSGVGFAAIPAAIQGYSARRGNEPPLGEFMIGPSSARDIDDWHKDSASGFDMGTLYTMIAGLLNILIVFDAYAGPLPPPVSKKAGASEDDDDEPLQGTSPPKSATDSSA